MAWIVAQQGGFGRFYALPGGFSPYEPGLAGLPPQECEDSALPLS